MRTTLTIDRDVAKELERLRRQEHTSFRSLVNELLRTGLRTRATPAKAVPYRSPSFKMGVRPGVDPARFNQLLDELEIEEHGS